MPSIILASLLLLLNLHLLIQATPVLPPFVARSYARLNNLDEPPTNNDENRVAFTTCSAEGYKINGAVKDMFITPCQRPQPNDPCTFVKGRNYTIDIDFVSNLDSENPRSSIVAGDPKEGPYAYSGQSFAACKVHSTLSLLLFALAHPILSRHLSQYTSCPIQANVPSTYVYHFQTLASDFNYLTFNVTDNFFGPSLFCAGTSIHFKKHE